MKQKKEVSIRKATIKDFKAVYELEKQFVNYQVKRYKLHSIVDPNYVNAPLKNELEKRLRSRKEAIFLIGKDNQPIGFIGIKLTKPPTWSRSKKSAEISQIFILPENHGKGYGKLLINHAIKFLKKKGCDLVTLGVHPKNPAQRLYSKVGFKPDFIQMYKTIK